MGPSLGQGCDVRRAPGLKSRDFARVASGMRIALLGDMDHRTPVSSSLIGRARLGAGFVLAVALTGCFGSPETDGAVVGTELEAQHGRYELTSFVQPFMDTEAKVGAPFKCHDEFPRGSTPVSDTVVTYDLTITPEMADEMAAAVHSQPQVIVTTEHRFRGHGTLAAHDFVLVDTGTSVVGSLENDDHLRSPIGQIDRVGVSEHVIAPMQAYSLLVVEVHGAGSADASSTPCLGAREGSVEWESISVELSTGG
jgi:hypothetical protein